MNIHEIKLNIKCKLLNWKQLQKHSYIKAYTNADMLILARVYKLSLRYNRFIEYKRVARYCKYTFNTLRNLLTVRLYISSLRKEFITRMMQGAPRFSAFFPYIQKLKVCIIFFMQVYTRACLTNTSYTRPYISYKNI